MVASLRDLRRATESLRRGDYSARVPVVATDETGALAQSFNTMIEGLEERERLRSAFGAYVDPGLAEGVEVATRETGDRVLITEDTRRRLRTEAFELDVRKTVELKGKQVHVELWAPRAHPSDASNHGRAGASAA